MNLEDELLKISLGESINPHPKAVQYSGVRFFSFEEGSVIKHMPNEEFVKGWPHVVDFSFNLKEGQTINRITSSLNRYGHLTLIAGNREAIEEAFDKYERVISDECL